MKDRLLIVAHLLTTLAKLLKPGGAKAIVEKKAKHPIWLPSMCAGEQ
jgi:hypothetical protein